MRQWAIYVLIATALIAGWFHYHQLISENALLQQGLDDAIARYNTKEAEHQRDLSLLDKTIKTNQKINRLSNDLQAKLQNISGCTNTIIDADTVEWVRQYRDSQIPARASTNQPDP